MQTALDHTGLSVADLGAAESFYAAAFGFEPEFRFELPHAIRGVMLKLASGGRLELFERPGSGPGMNADVPLDALATRGFGHFALTAPDIQLLFDAAVDAGGRAVSTPAPSPEPGVRFAFLADPEGNLVELVER